MTESHPPVALAPVTGGRPAGPSDVGDDGHLEGDRAGTSPVGPLVAGVGLLALSVLLLTQVWGIRADGFSPEGPRFFPLIVLGLLTVLALVYLAQQVLAMGRGGEGHPAERFEHMLAAGVLVALLVVYAFVLNPLGYVVATSAFTFAAARTMGSRNVPRDVVVSIGLSLVVYLVFTRALGVFLPEGVLPL